MNLKRKQLWPNLKHCCVNYMERLKKTIKTSVNIVEVLAKIQTRHFQHKTEA
jgi:hypothetical protein